MGEKQPSAAATRLAEVAIAEHMRCPGLDSPGWEKYGSPGDCALHRVALALDDAGVALAVEALDMIYTHPEQPLKVQAWATTALAALTGEQHGR